MKNKTKQKNWLKWENKRGHCALFSERAAGSLLQLEKRRVQKEAPGRQEALDGKRTKASVPETEQEIGSFPQKERGQETVLEGIWVTEKLKRQEGNLIKRKKKKTSPF